jgi:protein-disulfide reductase (glutathione)
MPVMSLLQKWSPDGGYIPRIMYAQPNGDLRTELKNKMGNPKYGYFYSSAWEVEQGMRDALARLVDRHAEL